MNKFQLFRELRRHRKLEEKRTLNMTQNKVAKWVVGFLSVFMILYLVFISIMIALIANNSESYTSLEIIFGLMPFLLTFDFFLRFSAQQTPAHIVKPYLLLPMSSYDCVDMFLLTSMLNTNNLIWMALFLPFAIMSVVFSFGVGITLAMLVLCWLMVVLSSQWYIISRTLITDSQLWWALIIGVFALVYSPLYIGKHAGFTQFFELYGSIGTILGDGSLLPLLGIILVLVVLYVFNRRLQYAHIWKELAHTEQTTLKSVSQFSFLERYGEVGEYLRLEIKSILRNKNPRKGFISATVVVLMFSLIISLTDVYDGQYMTQFWCIYNLVIYGAIQLTRVMCNEGNYIDALMVRKENILSLLKAKYFFYTALLILPFVLMVPTVIAGKWSLLMLFSYTVFTAGFQYFIIMQLAVYNKQTTPLNTKFVAKVGIENNFIQLVVPLVVFFVPMLIASIMQALIGPTWCYLVMLIIGLAFVGTHNLWLRNIYKRMMKRRYDNLASFRASR